MNEPLRVMLVPAREDSAQQVRTLLSAGGVSCELDTVDRGLIASAIGPHQAVILEHEGDPGVLESLRGVLGACPGVPVILLGEALGDEAGVQAMKIGAADVVNRSQPERLARAVTQAAERRQPKSDNGHNGDSAAAQLRSIEAELRHSRERFSNLAEAVPEVVWVAMANGELDYFNPRWTEYTGLSGDESGQWQSLIHPDDLASTLAAWKHALDDSQSVQFEHRIRRHDGEYRWFLTRAVPFRSESGEVVRWVGTSTDIHEHKSAEQQLRQFTETLEQRVAERTARLVEHQEQLRAMASDLALTEQRERRRLANELHDYLAQLLVVCKMKARMAEQVVRSTRAEALLEDVIGLLEQSIKYTRSLTAELSPTILYEAGLSPALYWLAEQMQRHGIKVQVSEDGSPARLAEDHAVLAFQAVRELLINVARHAHTTSAKLHMGVLPSSELAITVTDEGRGFAASQGLGPEAPGKFGLFSIRERLEAIGGRLEVDSTPGQGTRARVLLPQAAEGGVPVDSESAALAVQAGEARPRQARRRLTRVLLADDHSVVREGLRNLIESQPRLQVVGEASDGEEVVSQARSLRPDVIVMDVNMPKLNGIEATRRIRREMPDVAIIGLSMHDDRAIADSMREAGANLYLSKDGPSEDLCRAIQQAHLQMAG